LSSKIYTQIPLEKMTHCLICLCTVSTDENKIYSEFVGTLFITVSDFSGSSRDNGVQ